ncbi:S24 family peptidase [Bacteroidota bacterium]
MNELEILGQEDVKSLSRNLLKDKKIVKLRLGGCSMYPNLLPGDIATVRQVKGSSLKLRQVVVVEIDGRWIAHRLVGRSIVKKETYFITQGDSVFKPDVGIQESEIIGVVEQVDRAGEVIFPSASWLYVYLRPLPQIASRIVVRIKRKLKLLR